MPSEAERNGRGSRLLSTMLEADVVLFLLASNIPSIPDLESSGAESGPRVVL